MGAADTSQRNASRGGVSLESLGERRQLTVMFCDLVGSTNLASRLDPEDLHEIIGAYQRCIVDVATRFEGFVARFLGDGAVVYFGYPHAREDDAERAVRAGLSVTKAVSQLTLLGGYRPQVRVGIATGLVVVGNIATGGALYPDVTGETPNLAARLQTLAEPNSVIIAASTRRLLGSRFDYRELEPRELKGFAQPVPAWLVLGTNFADRFEIPLQARSTPSVGRDAEIDLMLRRWSEAAAGHGQVVLVSGDAGIGKSRLATTLRERIGAEPHVRLRYFCSPDGRSTPLYPCITQIEHAAGIAPADDTQRKLEKFVATLAPLGPSAADVAALADLLGLPNDGRLPRLDPDPRIRRARMLDALVRLLERISERQPVLAVFEDLQWIDPTSRELLDRVMERVDRWPMLLVATHRPDFHPPWAGQGHVTALPLAALERQHAIALIRNIAGRVKLAEGVVNEILRRSDGVPLFLEELTIAVLEGERRGDLREDAGVSAPFRGSAVPDTLHASLMARLDRLGAAKELAYIGAAIGREFSTDLLSAVAQKRDTDLDWALKRLTDSGLVFRRPSPRATYQFKHALIRDAAYGAMLRDTRRALHRRIAEALESPAGSAEARPELLAHHCAEAGLSEKALAYWIAAGRDALEKSAMVEAVARLRMGLDLVQGLPESVWRHQRELDLQVALGTALIATKGYVAPDTIKTFSRARSLCKQLNQSPQLVSVLHGQWVQAFMRNELASARRRALELLELGERSGDAYLRWTGRRLLGTTCFPMGEFVAGREHFVQSLAFHEQIFGAGGGAPAGDTETAGVIASGEAYVLELAYDSWTLIYLGQLDHARQRRDQALRQAQTRSQAYTISHAENGRVFIDLMLNAPQTALAGLDRLETLTGGHEIIYYSAMGAVFRGWCLAALGQEREGIAHINRGIAANRGMGTLVYMPSFLKYLADAYRMARQPDAGLEALAEATAIVESTQSRQDEAEIHRVRGELLALAGDPNPAEVSLLLALRTAKVQSAHLLELRAAASLARFWRDRGKPALAREHLASAYGWFTEGHDTAVLAEAKALLDSLV